MRQRRHAAGHLDDVARTQIKRWMKATGVTQEVLAARIGRNQVWLSRYLKGEYDTDLTTLDQMARVFDHPLTALLSLPTDPAEGQILTWYRAIRPEQRAHVAALLRALARAD